MECLLNLIYLMIMINVFRNNKDHTVKSLYEGRKGTTRTCKFIKNENGKTVINWC